MKKDPRVYLVQIVERADRIRGYTSAGRQEFLSRPMIQDAVVRNLEVIGEAVKRIPDDFRTRNPGIPWRGLAALRDVLIHQYEGVSLPEVWEIVENQLPEVRDAIAAVLPPPDQLEREIAGDD